MSLIRYAGTLLNGGFVIPGFNCTIVTSQMRIAKFPPLTGGPPEILVSTDCVSSNSSPNHDEDQQ